MLRTLNFSMVIEMGATTLKVSHRLESLLSDGELVIIPNAKHELNLENPLEFAQALNWFLNNVN